MGSRVSPSWELRSFGAHHPEEGAATGTAFYGTEGSIVIDARGWNVYAKGSNTPVETGKWQWENLAETVLDTIGRAKLRAVEPDMIETLNGFATLLPSTIAEFSTSQSTISLDYSLNLAFIYQQVAVLSAASRNG